MVEINLKGRVAVVTGASSGIGAETARVMARCGARVLVTGRDRARLDATVAEIEADGGRAFAVTADLVDSEGVTRIANAAADFSEAVAPPPLAKGHPRPIVFTDS